MSGVDSVEIYFVINNQAIIGSTVNIGFYDQPSSQGSGSLNPVMVAKLSGFSLGLATRWSLKPM